MIETTIRIALVLVLMIMGIQDFKYRGISWCFFPVLAILLWFSNADFILLHFMMNVGFLALIYVLLSVWVSIKEQAFVNLTRLYLGPGDLLFLLCLSLYFPPLSFFLFYSFSLLLISIAYGLYFLLIKSGKGTIPLAGIQGIILLFAMIISWYLNIDLSDGSLFEAYFEPLRPIL